MNKVSTLTQKRVLLLLALDSIFGLDVWSTDVNQAYFQLADRLPQRRIFCQPDGLDLGYDEFPELMLPLYGLSDSME